MLKVYRNYVKWKGNLQRWFSSLTPPNMKLTTVISRHTRHYLRVLDSPKVLVISGVEDSEGVGGLVGG